MLHKIMHHPFLGPLRSKPAPEIGMLLLRLVVGIAFMYHGYPKLFGNPTAVVNFFRSIHIPAPAILEPFVGIVEFFGGMLVILGLGGRALGLMLAVDMVVAVLAAKGLGSWKSVELEVLLLAGALDLMLSGAGAYSADAVLMEKMKKEHEAAMPMAKP